MTSLDVSPYSSIVNGQENISFAIEKILVPAPGHAEPSAPLESDRRLNIAVVFTSLEATLAALKKAGHLATSLAARVTLVVPQVVPYPLPLETPPVLLEFSERRFHALASESPVETSVRIYLCRDRFEALKTVLIPGSIVVLGGSKKWWPTQEKRLARRLKKAGHEIVFTETE